MHMTRHHDEMVAINVIVKVPAPPIGQPIDSETIYLAESTVCDWPPLLQKTVGLLI